MAKATLLYRTKLIDSEGYITEMVIWRLPKQDTAYPHGLKYRLYFGTHRGTCLVRYDNERGKGDHKHIGKKEMPYRFKNVEKLIEDFKKDIQKVKK